MSDLRSFIGKTVLNVEHDKTQVRESLTIQFTDASFIQVKPGDTVDKLEIQAEDEGE